MISVVIPIYNAEPRLRRCLDSVLNSKRRDFELILVNDGSTDNSPGICREYAEKDGRVRLISQPNRGASSARNRGLEACRGEWVIFVDADDMISPDFLELADREIYQDQDLLLFDFARTEAELAPADFTPEELCFGPADVPELLRSLLLRRQLTEGGSLNFVSPCGKAYRTECIRQSAICFSPDLSFGEDKLFNTEYLTRVERCVYLPKPVYFYDCRQGSLSRRFCPERIQNVGRMLTGIRTVLERGGFFSALEEDFLSSVQEQLIFFIFAAFSPGSLRRKARSIGREMRDTQVYEQALLYRRKGGAQSWAGRALLFLFQKRQYAALRILVRIGHIVMRLKNPGQLEEMRESGWLP